MVAWGSKALRSPDQQRMLHHGTHACQPSCHGSACPPRVLWRQPARGLPNACQLHPQRCALQSVTTALASEMKASQPRSIDWRKPLSLRLQPKFLRAWLPIARLQRRCAAPVARGQACGPTLPLHQTSICPMRNSQLRCGQGCICHCHSVPASASTAGAMAASAGRTSMRMVSTRVVAPLAAGHRAAMMLRAPSWQLGARTWAARPKLVRSRGAKSWCLGQLQDALRHGWIS